MTVPEQLQPYLEDLEKTRKENLLIHGEIGETAPLESKFGGQPYWLKTDAYPTSKYGERLHLLAQINFSEMTESIPNYPTEGILQFFIGDDDLYGADFDDPTTQDTFRVVYHEKIELDRSKWLTDFPKLGDEDYSPIEKECKLSFEQSNEMVSGCDYRFNEITAVNKLLEEATDEDYEVYEKVMEAYDELACGQGAKLGGYPFFTQEDPRAYGDYLTYDTILLQVDTEHELGIMWGDSGVANFFIAAEDLKKRDFSKVLYNWDCY